MPFRLMGNTPDPKIMLNLSVEGWAKVVAAIASTLTLLVMIWKPIKKWLVYKLDCMIVETLKRCKKTVRRILRDEVLVEEVRMIEDSHAKADANSDRLEMAEAAIIAHGKVLNEFPKFVGQMQGLPRAIEQLTEAMMGMREDVGVIKGRMGGGNEVWDGINRRKRDVPVKEERRHDEEDKS
jgi:uncharacterized ubiquitin-like protein YukD